MHPESMERNNQAKKPIGIAWNYTYRGQIGKAQGFKDDENQLILKVKAILDEIGNWEYLEGSLRAHQQLKLNFKQAAENKEC